MACDVQRLVDVSAAAPRLPMPESADQAGRVNAMTMSCRSPSAAARMSVDPSLFAA